MLPGLEKWTQHTVAAGPTKIVPRERTERKYKKPFMRSVYKRFSRVGWCLDVPFLLGEPGENYKENGKVIN